MKSSVKTLLVIVSVLAVGTAGYFLLFRRERSSEQNDETNQKPPRKEDEDSEVVVDYSSNPLVIDLTEKANYMIGTLKTLKVDKNNKIVSASTGKPINEGLAFGVWYLHQKDIKKWNKLVTDSTESEPVKIKAAEIVNNADIENKKIFSPSIYNEGNPQYAIITKS